MAGLLPNRNDGSQHWVAALAKACVVGPSCILRHFAEMLDRIRMETGGAPIWVAQGTYDPAGNLTLVDYPAGTVEIALQYDPVNRLTNMVDAVGTTRYTFDVAGRLLTEDGPNPRNAMTEAPGNPNAHRSRQRLAGAIGGGLGVAVAFAVGELIGFESFWLGVVVVGGGAGVGGFLGQKIASK